MTKKDILQRIIANKKAVGLSKKPKYATRKLSVGLVSCLLGYALLISPSSAQELHQNNDVINIGEEATESGDKNIANISNGDLNKDKNLENNSQVSRKETEDKQKDINDDNKSFTLSYEQIKKLKDANFTDAEINLLVENIIQRLNNDKTFDVNGHIDDVVKTKVSAKKAVENTDDNDKNRIAEEHAQDIEQAQKDAVYSPGQEGDTQSYSGTAYIYRKDKLNDVGKETLSGVNVYLQWVDYDGYVSKVYKTTSRPDGTFTFNFQKPEVDKYGNIHHFQLAANPNFAIRTWVENPDPEKYSVVKPGDQKYGFHTRLNRVNESWDFTAGVNRIVGGQVALQEKPMKNDWLVKPKDEWSKAPSSDGIWENQGIYGNVRGQVWFENGDPKGSDARGWKKDSWDVNASGNEVVASYVNDEVARLFDKWKENHKDYKMEDFRKAQEELIRDYEAKNGKGSHIAETVYTKVDKDGNYYLPFRGLYGISPYKQNSGAKISHTISDEEYGKLVKDEDITHSNLMAWNGTVGQKHRHINWQYMYVSPLIKRYNMWGNTSANNMFNDLSGNLASNRTRKSCRWKY